MEAHAQRLSTILFGNPHSVNPTSEVATLAIEQTRSRILKYLNASKDEYAVIFTPNATGAARLVGESYNFTRRTKLLLTSDNHNSVNGIREYAQQAGSKTNYIHTQGPDLRISTATVDRALRASSAPTRLLPRRRGLFAYPAQSNFSGVRHPLSWLSLAEEYGYDVLLDAAAYLPSAMLDLSAVKPHFVIVSWYKLFGYPTGLGCLIARRDALQRLRRPWFSGGTVQRASVRGGWHVMASQGEAFEDGTVNFLSIPDISVGLDWLVNIGMEVIGKRVGCLTGHFIERLRRLQHNNSQQMVIIYGPVDMRQRGGTVCFNLIDAAGSIVDERLVAMESAIYGISLRTGCFCNPGAGEDAFGIPKSLLLRLRGQQATSDEYLRILAMPSGGAIRISFGLASTVRDVDCFFTFLLQTYLDRVTTTDGLPPRSGC